MQVLVVINGVHLTALLDADYTHNFVNTDAAARAGITLSGLSGLCLAVANGDWLTSLGCCHNLNMAIDSEQSQIVCYGLALGSYDMYFTSNGWSRLDPSFGTSAREQCSSFETDTVCSGRQTLRHRHPHHCWLHRATSWTSCSYTSTHSLPSRHDSLQLATATTKSGSCPGRHRWLFAPTIMPTTRSKN
jgi:hypothetical protein